MRAFDKTSLRPDAPAFPTMEHHHNQMMPVGGLNARQHAAIALRVPDSGAAWLDEMIRASLRDEAADKALAALIVKDKDGANCGARNVPKMASWAYEYATAMLAAREEK